MPQWTMSVPTEAVTTTTLYSKMITVQGMDNENCYFDGFNLNLTKGTQVFGKMQIQESNKKFIFWIYRGYLYEGFRCNQLNILDPPPVVRSGKVSSFSFDWTVPYTAQYYFLFFNLEMGPEISISCTIWEVFTQTLSSPTSTFTTSSVSTSAASLLSHTVYSSIGSSLQMPQVPQSVSQPTNNTLLAVALAVIVAVVIGAAFLYNRRKA